MEVVVVEVKNKAWNRSDNNDKAELPSFVSFFISVLSSLSPPPIFRLSPLPLPPCPCHHGIPLTKMSRVVFKEGLMVMVGPLLLVILLSL